MFTYKYFLEYCSFYPVIVILLLSLFLIDMILRALSLWRAARGHQIVWFLALLCLNTMSILPIIYLLFFANDAIYYQNKNQGKNQGKSTAKLPAKTTTRHKKS
ncbi:MAG TPA: DUF5652 family protein [Candidatus Woesebacteria bacterium]|nr:DUF5652 family protein [Candidatus Woesebacteria bacterium]